MRAGREDAAAAEAAHLRAILPGVPLVESPFFEKIAPACGFDGETLRIGRELNRDGLAVMRFPDAEFEARAERIKNNLAPRYDLARWRTAGWRKNSGLRLQDAWKLDDDVRAIAVNPAVMAILKAIYGRSPWPFQTLNFPVGTQQHYHSDSVSFSSIPERFMCGVWVALEDVSEEAGPLEYYPGSHKWPIVYNDQIGARIAGTKLVGAQTLYHKVWEALVATSGIAPKHFAPRKGDAVIWAANLLHGGAKHRDPQRTRWSQVTHYYFEDCCYFTPMLSDPKIGKLRLRNMINIATGEAMKNVYLGAPLAGLGPGLRLGEMRAVLRRLAGPTIREIQRRFHRAVH
jgi:hypothetical protein